jgi:hypothetical protein
LSDVLHIVCLDAPSPPDYGGAIDMYYMVKSLAETGRKIHLHYFGYRSDRNVEGLEQYCEAIDVYKRKTFFSSLFSSLPYIVHSRINPVLINRLNQTNQPILLSSFHCAGIIPFITNPERIVVRCHNDEAAYYNQLYHTASSPVLRSYYKRESLLLGRFQRTLPKDIKLACLSDADRQTLQYQYGFQKSFFIPSFLPWQQLRSRNGKGSFCLYHGNLSVPENEKAAYWLATHIFSNLPIPFVIAGKGISPQLKEAVKKYAHIKLAKDPRETELEDLIGNAQIHLVPSFNVTGVKLKLLHGLFNGRFCLANQAAIQGSGVIKGVDVKESAEDFRRAIPILFNKEFTDTDQEERSYLLSLYHNRTNAEKLNALW